MIQVALTELQRQVALDMGYARDRANRIAKPDTKGDAKAEANGAAGEIAVCSVFNIPFDLTDHVREGTPDCYFRSGRTGDVKTTDWKNGKLLVPEMETVEELMEKADIYILVVGYYASPHPMEIKGWCYNNRVIVPERRKYQKRGRNYAYELKQEELDPIETLIAEENNVKG